MSEANPPEAAGRRSAGCAVIDRDTMSRKKLIGEMMNINRQIRKEASLSMLLYVLFFIWWYATGYGLSDGVSEDFTYVLGLPMWFFLSCVVGYVLFCAATIMLVKTVFRNIPLDRDDEDKGANK